MGVSNNRIQKTMKVEFDKASQSPLEKDKAINYAITLIYIQKAIRSGQYNQHGSAAIYTSCGNPIRFIQEHQMVKAPLTNRAIKRIESFGLPTTSHLSKDELGKMSKDVKRIGGLSRTPLAWEHIISVQYITDEIKDLPAQINDPAEMIELIEENTFIVIKDVATEQHVKGEGKGITRTELESWNNSITI